jgi:hypothetical protein
MSKIEIRFLNENAWRDIREAALVTVGKENSKTTISDDLLLRYLLSEDTPIRAAVLRIKMDGIPYRNSVHLARHVHGQPYVSRNTGSTDVNDPRVHIEDWNLQGLIDASRKRLCAKYVDITTFSWIVGIKKKLFNMGGKWRVISLAMVPNCIYRYGCTAFMGSCGIFDPDEMPADITARYKKYSNQICGE